MPAPIQLPLSKPKERVYDDFKWWKEWHRRMYKRKKKRVSTTAESGG